MRPACSLLVSLGRCLSLWQIQDLCFRSLPRVIPFSSLMAYLWPCCRCLLLRCGSAVDAAVRKALKPEPASAPAGTSAQQQSVAHFAQEALSAHSAHAPLAGSSTTIANAVDSSSAELRRMVSDLPTVCLTTTGIRSLANLFFSHRSLMMDAREMPSTLTSAWGLL